MLRLFSTLCLVLMIVSCKQKASNNIVTQDSLIGTWDMERVMEYGEDETEKHNPAHDRWVEFKADGTFVSDGTPFGRNQGRWKLDQGRSILIIDSDVDDDDSEWNVSLLDDVMTWTGIGHPRKENTTLIHRRGKSR